MSKVTLRIIAEETGLSKYAVSRALSGKSGVSDATREHVSRAADRLGYSRPTRNPASIASTTIGAIFDEGDHANGELNVQIQNGMQTEAELLGYSVLAHWTSGGNQLVPFIDRCNAILAVNIKNRPALKRIMASRKPVVRSGWAEPLEQVDLVGGTDREAGLAVAEYLYGIGHREIVFVHGDLDLRGRRERLYGLMDFINQRPEMICHDISWDTGKTFSQGLDEVLDDGGRPTAFFCGHDGLAITACTDILSRGWRIPRDVSLVGFGDFSSALQVSPALTTVRMDGREFGRQAVRRLHTRLSQPSLDHTPLRLLVPNILIERESTGPAPKPDARTV